VDTVGGLMAKLLGRVPLPGAFVEAHGLRFEAEKPTGRRKQISTVLISKTVPEDRSRGHGEAPPSDPVRPQRSGPTLAG
jgi:CBS domain containing-hemolysin-like protein